jgi:hypothetical protein
MTQVSPYVKIDGHVLVTAFNIYLGLFFSFDISHLSIHYQFIKKLNLNLFSKLIICHYFVNTCSSLSKISQTN